ncbi:tRNA guanosine(34) transglycosylase Tgt [Candidatus Saccharibacteria bacterium]|nr:tRNA guanosine(34) transglycosylase Tgt [Candidatus Saccharibacteria bacterium]
MFKEVKIHKNGARSGLLKTRITSVKSPFFMPVATRGAVKGLEPQEVAATGATVLLSNTYHLHLSPGEEQVKKLGGLHAFCRWPGPMLTDSDGFQVFSLAHARKITEEGVTFKDPASGKKVVLTPEKSMKIQLDLGADIIMAFDDVTGLDPSKAKVREEEAVERTHRWLLRCIKEFKKLTKDSPTSKRPLLFGIAQGGLNKKLRQKSLEFVQSTEVDGVAIGGLSVGEPLKDMHDMLKFLSPLYDVAKIRYLMGVGEPINMRFAIEHGIDMFDCVLPTRNGRHGNVWISGDKKLNLKNTSHSTDTEPIDRNCNCYACRQGYSRAYLRHLFKVGDPLAGKLASIHNLKYLQSICEEYQ